MALLPPPFRIPLFFSRGFWNEGMEGDMRKENGLAKKLV